MTDIQIGLVFVAVLVGSVVCAAVSLYRVFVDADQMHAECEGYGPVRR